MLRHLHTVTKQYVDAHQQNQPGTPVRVTAAS
jgi:hypothetical protein